MLTVNISCLININCDMILKIEILIGADFGFDGIYET